MQFTPRILLLYSMWISCHFWCSTTDCWSSELNLCNYCIWMIIVTMHGTQNSNFVIVPSVIASNSFSFHMYQNAQAMSMASQKFKFLNGGICKSFDNFKFSCKICDKSREMSLRGFSLLSWETVFQKWKCQICSSIGVNFSLIWTLFDTVHYSLGYLQFQDAYLGSSLGKPTSNIRQLNQVSATVSSASLSAGSSLIDVRLENTA